MSPAPAARSGYGRDQRGRRRRARGPGGGGKGTSGAGARRRAAPAAPGVIRYNNTMLALTPQTKPGATVRALSDFLRSIREPVVAAWAAEVAPPGANPAPVRSRLEPIYDGLVERMQDTSGALHQQYMEQVIKPRLRAGLTVEDLQAGAAPLVRLIQAAIDAEIADATVRHYLYEQLATRVRSARAAWNLAAAQVVMEAMSRRR